MTNLKGLSINQDFNVIYNVVLFKKSVSMHTELQPNARYMAR
jgi:hypothetical protein